MADNTNPSETPTPESKPPTNPPPAIEVVVDDKSAKRLKALETKHSWLERQMQEVTKERDELRGILETGKAVPSPTTPGKSMLDEFLGAIGLDLD